MYGSPAPVSPNYQPLARIGENLPAHSDRMDLSGSVSFFRRWRRLILAFLVLGIVLGLAVSAYIDRVYTARAEVMLTNEVDDATRAGGTQAGRAAISNELVDTQVALISSREMAERVAKALQMDTGLQPQERRNLLDTLQRNVEAKRTGDSYAIEITFDAPEPDRAALVVNEFARQFTDWELRSNKEVNAKSREMVKGRLAELRNQAQADMQALQSYRIQNNLLSTSGASLTEQEISNYNQEVSRARAEAAEADARLSTALAQLRSGSSGDDVGEALGSPVISSLRSREAELASEVARLSSRYGSNYPQLVGAKNQLSEVRSQIQSEIGRVISNLRAQRAVSAQRLGSLSGSLANARSKLAQNNAAMVGLSDLERASNASREIYETYLNSYKQLLAAEGTERNHARILTLAEVPLLPSSPNIPLNLVLAAVIGLGCGILAAYIAEALLAGVLTSDDVRVNLGQHFLGSIPLLSSVSENGSHEIDAVRDEPKSVFVESFRELAASIDQASPSTNQIIAITSSMPREGKTITASCLSHVYASEGQRTLLIDCDLRRRGVSRLLDTPDDHPGLIEVLSGEVKLNIEEFAHESVFCVLPVRPSERELGFLLTGQTFVDFLNQLRPHFNRIVLDLPPVLPIAASRILASRADAVVMAAHWGKTPKSAIKAALSRLPYEHVNVAGVVLTQIDFRRRRFFAQEDPAFYYSSYREYYG